MRWAGSHVSMRCRSAMPSFPSGSTRDFRFCAGHTGNLESNLGSRPNPGHVFSVGVPSMLQTVSHHQGRYREETYLKILESWSLSEPPENSGRPRAPIWAMIQPAARIRGQKPQPFPAPNHPCRHRTWCSPSPIRFPDAIADSFRRRRASMSTPNGCARQSRSPEATSCASSGLCRGGGGATRKRRPA